VPRQVRGPTSKQGTGARFVAGREQRRTRHSRSGEGDATGSSARGGRAFSGRRGT
jgi:hypothetical protein